MGSNLDPVGPLRSLEGDKGPPEFRPEGFSLNGSIGSRKGNRQLPDRVLTFPSLEFYRNDGGDRIPFDIDDKVAVHGEHLGGTGSKRYRTAVGSRRWRGPGRSRDGRWDRSRRGCTRTGKHGEHDEIHCRTEQGKDQDPGKDHGLLREGGFGSVSSGGMVLLSTASARDQVAAMAATLATSAGVSFTGGSAGDWASRGEVVSGAGETGAATGAATTGIVTGGAAAGLTGAPQDSQNLAFAPSAAPHCRQAGRASIFAPHDSQNFIPGVTGLPHFRQVWGFAVMYMHHTDSARSSVLILVVLC